MKAVVVTTPGDPEVLTLGDAPQPVCRSGEVRVSVRAAGLNRADLLQRQGRYPPPPGASDILGLELAGEVVEVSSPVTRFRTGDRVMALVTGGGYAEEAVVPEAAALAVPDNLDWPQAAAVPEAFLTAWLNLFELGKLQRGQTVLIHAGASGVGMAAIQLARETGARVLTTAGSSEKAQFCKDLGAERVVLRHTEDFAEAAREFTGGEGVDLVLDVVGAPSFAGNLAALRKHGRLVLIGFLGGSRGELDLGPVLRKSLTVTGTTLRGTPLEVKARLVEAFSEFALPRLGDGRLRVPVDRTFSWKDAAAAHRYMGENRNAGKIVLVMD